MPATSIVTNPDDAGPGSLRDAIHKANSGGEPYQIVFRVGSGAKAIKLLSALPEIVTPIVLDASSQPGFAGSPLIEVDGSQAGPGASGLMIFAPDCTIRGIGIVRFDGWGIVLSGTGRNNLTCNLIGIDALGDATKGNTWGVHVQGAHNVIGGTSHADANVISGNRKDGLVIVGGGHNIVQGNFIGTDPAGARSVANGWHGVLVFNSPKNLVGGNVKEARNIISGNGRWGVRVAGAMAKDNRVSGNFVGTDRSGTYAVPNGRSGVLIYNAPWNIVGGYRAEEGNLISGNARQGVNVDGASLRMEFDGSPLAAVSTGQGDCHDNIVIGNKIGTDITGTEALPNGLHGILVFMAQSNTIGGTHSGAGNIISGNLKNGVNVLGSNPKGKDWRTYLRWNFGDDDLDLETSEPLPAHLNAKGNIVAGNIVGLDASAMLPLGNGESGVAINHAPENVIGGIEAEAANTIACNGKHGVHVMGATAVGNEIYGNLIGCDSSRTTALGNAVEGVRIHDGSRNQIGGEDVTRRNMIVGHKTCDVSVHGEQAADNFGRNFYTLEPGHQSSPAHIRQRVRISKTAPSSNDIA